MIRKLMAAATLTAVLLMSGCATSRSEIKLKDPTVVAPVATATSAQHVVVIGKITDERVFAEAPDDPSTPTLGFGGADKATDDVKARAVGRKRNSWGKALGDVLLQPGQTVEAVIRQNLVAAFEQAGYQVKGEGDAGPSPLMVDVHIKQFWSWFTPGAFVVTLSNNIATDLVFNGAATPVVVSTHVEDAHAVATEDSWIQIVDKGLDAYRAEVVQRVRNSVLAPTTAAGASAATEPAQPSANAATTVAPATAVPAQTSPASAVSATEAAAAQPVAETEAQAATPSPAPAVASPVAAAPESVPVTATSPQDSAATAAIAPLAQTVAGQLGCGAVQANGATTFVAPCGDYSVLIDCDSGQCRPLHTVNVKHDE